MPMELGRKCSMQYVSSVVRILKYPFNLKKTDQSIAAIATIRRERGARAVLTKITMTNMIIRSIYSMEDPNERWF